MSKPLPPVRVAFDGEQLWWLENDDGSGALAPLEHCDEDGNVVCLGESYAHVFRDGNISRYGEIIGHRDDLVRLEASRTVSQHQGE